MTGTDRSLGWTAPASPPTTTILLRHGDTPLSAELRFSGTGDSDLTPEGVKQIRAVAARLQARGGVGAIVASPLRRAWHSAQIAAETLGLEAVAAADLRETDFGVWEGHTLAEVQARWPDELEAWLADQAVAPPEGESFAATAARVQRVRSWLVEAFPKTTVLVVSHVTPIKMLVRQALYAPPTAVYRLHLGSASLSEVDWYADGLAVLRAFNDTHHLATL